MTNQEMMSSWLSINETTNVNECQSASIVCSFSLVSLSRCSTNISTEYNHCNRLQWLYTKQWQVGVVTTSTTHSLLCSQSFFLPLHTLAKKNIVLQDVSLVPLTTYSLILVVLYALYKKKKSKRQSTVEEVNGLGEWYSLIPGVCISM